MAEFQIPQFIEEKPKIIGPFTLGQFFYLAGSALIAYVSYWLFTFALFLVIAGLSVGAGLALAFVKLNGRDLPTMVAYAASYIWKPRKYTWQRAMQQTTLGEEDLKKLETIRNAISLQDKIKSLAQKVSTGARADTGYQTVTFITGEKKVAKRVDY